MEYLPTGPEYNPSLMDMTGNPVTYDNPADYMDAMMKIQTDAAASGLDIKYPKMHKNILPQWKEYTEKHKTIWDIVNE